MAVEIAGVRAVLPDARGLSPFRAIVDLLARRCILGGLGFPAGPFVPRLAGGTGGISLWCDTMKPPRNKQNESIGTCGFTMSPGNTHAKSKI